MTPSERLRPPTLPLPSLLTCLGIAAIVIALAATRAEAQPGASWSASGDVSMRYRTTSGGPVYGRNASSIDETIETDLITSINVGATTGSANGDPGSLSIEDVGDDEAPRELGDVNVRFGTLTLNDSFVSGRIELSRPTASLVMRLSAIYDPQAVVVGSGATFTAEASGIGGSVGAGGIARVSGCTGSLGSRIGADIEIDASILNSGNFQGKQVITNTTVTGFIGTLRQGEFEFENVSLDMEEGFTVGGNTTSAPPTDTDFILTNSVFESATGFVRAGVGIATDFVMRGSTWRSFGVFQIVGNDTQADIGSGSRIDARSDVGIGNAHVTVASIAEESRIDVAGDFYLDGGAPSETTLDPPTLLTVGPGGVVDVEGTLTIGAFSTLTIDGGTVRVGALDNQGILNDPGGRLTVPEASGAAPVIAAALALAWLRRRSH